MQGMQRFGTGLQAHQMCIPAPPRPVVDIVPGKLTKMVIKSGEGLPIGGEEHEVGWVKGAKVTVDWSCRIHGERECLESSDRLAQGSFELRVGREFLVEAWEKCLKTMKLGEKARFVCSALMSVGTEKLIKVLRDEAKKKHQMTNEAGASAGGIANACEEVYCNCSFALQQMYEDNPDLLYMQGKQMEFEFELKEFLAPGTFTPDHWELSPGERWAAVPLKKEQGNEFFKQKRYEAAAQEYVICLAYVVTLKRHPEDIEGTVEELNAYLISALLNLSACLLKQGDYQGVVTHCTDAIKHDANNVKAHFRRGVALVRRGLDLEGAKADLEKVRELDPANTDAAKELQLLERKLKVARKKQKEVFTNFFKAKDGSSVGYYEDQVTVPAPEPIVPEDAIAAMPDGRLKGRCNFLLEQQEALEAQKKEAEEGLRIIQENREQLLAHRDI